MRILLGCCLHVAVLALAIPVFSHSAIAGPGFPVSDEAAHVHVIMPAKPAMAVNQSRDAKSKRGGIKQEKTWKLIQNGSMWLVSSTVLPKDVAYDPLSSIAINIAKASDGALVEQVPVSLDGTEGLEFLFKDKTFINRWRIFLIDKQTLVDIRYVGQPGTESSREVQNYFDSFALRGGPKSPASERAPAPAASTSTDLIERLKGRTIRVAGLVADSVSTGIDGKPFHYKEENWPLTLTVRDDGLIAWEYTDPTCPADGKFKKVEVLFGNRDGETPLFPGYRKEEVKCAGDSSGRIGQYATTMSATMRGSYTTVRLVSGNILSLTQEFAATAKKRTTGRSDVSSIVDYRTKFNVSISFGETTCEVVKVDWKGGKVDKDAANPGEIDEISRTVRIAAKTYCVIR
jgi:hypothetical protein